MINKIAVKHGHDIGGLMRYLFGPGRANEHRDQRVIAADEILDVADGTRLDAPHHWERVLELRHALNDHRVIARMAPEQGWVWHCAISLPAEETLSDEQWAIVARAAVARLGFDDSTGKAPCRWIAVHHGPSAGGNDHIHLAVNLMREDCSLAAPGRDRMAMSALCAQMKSRFGLHVVEGRPGRGRPPSYCSKSCRNRAWEVRSAEARLQRDIAAGVVRTGPVREVVRETVVETRFVPAPSEPGEPGATSAVPATAQQWLAQLAELAAQLREGELGRQHWHHAKLYNAMLDALVDLGAAYPGGLDYLERDAARRKRRR
ncbi:hypothetical protein ABT061_40615 [Streptosporangium sp. NPDC002544]|uniref:relaxase/mobilization nuclease domain-containing protein n=1 Tax=Streptosporangium sp. NPDC002544 TaxID=3154538 RepID=UPI0033208A45